jgi:hypothetical protein
VVVDVGESSGNIANDPAWRALKQLIAVANRGDADGYAQLAMRWPEDVPLDAQRRAGAYLWCAVQYRVKELLRRDPSPVDLHLLAVEAYPRFREVLGNADEIHLEEVLRTSLEFQPLRVRLRPGEFLVFGSAALGALFADAERDMEAMRPSLEIWWERNQGRLASLGVSGAPEGRP